MELRLLRRTVHFFPLQLTKIYQELIIIILKRVSRIRWLLPLESGIRVILCFRAMATRRDT